MAGALIGALRVSLSAETSAFEAGMKRSQRTAATTAQSIKSSLGGIGKSIPGLSAGIKGLLAALSIGSIISAGKAALEYASHLTELAETLGLTSKDLQTFSFAAGQVGISQEELNVGIQKLTISMGKAQLGSKAQADAFKAIGISIDQLKGKNTGEVFRLIAEKLQNVSDRSKRAAVEVALFGKAGAKLDNLLSGAEGKLDDLTRAAEELGIVLSDEQIRNADKTADRIAALQTVLKARIAGVVADNANAIFDMANALGDLAGALAKALGELSRFAAGIDKYGQPIKDFFATISNPKNSLPALLFGQGNNASQISVKLPSPTIVGGKAGAPVNVGHFLAGGGSKAKDDHRAEDALRDQFSFDQEIRRANIDILHAKEQLASDYVDQTAISIQILDAERDAYDAELRYKVALNQLTKGKEGLSLAQATQLKAAYDQKDALERQAVLDEEEAKRKEEYDRLDQVDFDLKKDRLQAELQTAETAQEQRDIQLRLLDLSYRQERARLMAVLADEKASFSATEEARRRLENLNKTYDFDKQAVLQNTRGPLEEFTAIANSAAKANEALQRLEVEGFNGLIDSVLALSEGLGSATQSLLQTLKNFLLGLARLELQKALGGILQGGGVGGLLGSIGSIFGGGSSGLLSAAGDTSASLSVVDLPSFASGGSFTVLGRSGIDKNIMSIGNIPIARVSYGERVNIGNDNAPAHSMSRGGNTYMTVNTPDADSFRRSEGQITRSWQRRMKY